LRFSSDLLEEIRNRCDIVDIISEYVHLKPAGKGFKGKVYALFMERRLLLLWLARKSSYFIVLGVEKGAMFLISL
jgi:hypothetical protein